jgi:hypothetical protein
MKNLAAVTTVVTMLLALVPWSAHATVVLGNHFKCYRTGTSADAPSQQKVLFDQFEEGHQVIVQRPLMICNPVSKCDPGPENCTEVFDPSFHLVCYQTINAAGTPAFEQRFVEVSNQFDPAENGQTYEVLSRQNLLCVPSFKADGLNGE